MILEKNTHHFSGLHSMNKVIKLSVLAALTLLCSFRAQADCISGNVGVCVNDVPQTYTLDPGAFSKPIYSFSGGTKVGGGTFSAGYITIQWNTPGVHTLTVEEFNPGVPYNICHLNIAVRTVAGGSVSSGAANVCQGSGTTLSLTGYSGYIQYWEKTTDGVNWESISHTGASYNTGGLSATTTFRVLVNDCGTDALSSSTTVTVVAPTPGGVSVSNGSFCSGESASGTATASGYSGIVQGFEKSEYSGGVWGAWTSVGGAHGVDTYNYSVSVPTRFRAVISSGTCSTIYSAYGEVQATAPSVAGSISGPSPVCSGAPFSLSLNGSQGTVQGWYSRTAQGSYGGNIGTPSNITISQPTYFKAAVKNGTCTTTAETPEFLVGIKPLAVGGTVSSPSGTTICQNESRALTLSGQSGTIKRWEKSTDSGSTWQTINNTTTSYNTGSLSVTTAFRAVMENECAVTANSSSVTITVVAPPNPGTASVTSGSPSVCTGESASGTVTVTGYTGFVQTWEKSEFVNGSWGAWQATGSPNGVDQYNYSVTLPTRFQAVFPSSTCGTRYSTAATISIATPTTAGYITGPIDVCANAPFNLTLNANVGTVLQWWIKDGTHDWAALSSPVNVTINRESQFKVQVQNGNCLVKETAPFTVAIKPGPTVGTLSPGITDICAGQNMNITLSAFTGTSVQWQKRPDGAEDFTTVTTNTNLSFSEPAQHAEWRAVISNVCGVTKASSVVQVHVAPKPPKPVNVTDHWYIENSSAYLTVSADNNLYSVRWYATPQATGTPLATSPSYMTPVLYSPQAYYVRAVDASGCESDVLTVEPQPVNTLPAPSNLKTEVVRLDGIKNATQMDALTEGNKHTQFIYLDGMGRAVQTVAVKATPAGNDLVQPVEYDVFGKSPKQYLPYAAATNDGAFKVTYKTDQLAFYNTANDKVADDANPYAITKFENSPLERVIEQGAPGQAWQPGTGHTSKIAYSFNTGATANAAEEVRRFNTNGTSTDFFVANKLHRTETTDANGNKTIIFTDTQGRTIAKKTQLDEVIDGVTVNYLETYYIYDEMGREKYIISPKGVAALKANGWTLTAGILDQYVHQFVYDQRGRLVEKKVPGQDWMYNVYDKLNRLVLTQDALLRADNKWMFVKYDKRGRTVMQGIYLNTAQTTRTDMQLLVDGLYSASNVLFPFNAWYEGRGITLHGYTNTSFPKLNADNSALEVLNVDYYDSYDFDNNGTEDFSYAPQGLTGEGSAIAAVTGLPTGSKRLLIGSTIWLYNYVFYDKYHRAIQVRSNNHRDATIDDLVTNVYDFEGKLLTSRTSHDAAPDIVHRYEYDQKARIKSIYGMQPAGVPVSWTSPVNVTAAGSTLTKTSGLYTWDAGAISTQGLPASKDGWMEFRAGGYTAKILGLAASNSSTNLNSINFGIYTDPVIHSIRIYENGADKGDFGTFTASDILKVEKRKGKIYYWKNQQLIYTSTVTPSGVLYVDCSLGTAYSSVSDVNLFTATEINLAQYDYNELGQLVDKKLHNTTGTSFIQSIDYRYTIQGQLSAINNAQLNADANLNDDTDDYFGMELLYNNVESGLNNDQHFNGNIAAIKWKSIGASNGAVDQKSYKYTYDKSGKLKSAAFQMHSGSIWSKEAGVHNEAMSYDHNGNIKSLQRNARKHQIDGVIASYTNETIDNLTYAYNSTYGDRLDKVEDAATGAGFNNGTSGTTTDYTYDLNGNLTADKNKGIDSIHYNFLGKVRRIKFSDGRVITYRYDAGGSKLLMKTYPAGSTTPVVTDYVNGFVYENGILKFFGSPEGRVVMNGNVPEYQYAIADHQGNTRVVFSSVTPGPDAPVASFEGNSGDGVSQYRNVDANYVVTSLAANHTASGNKVIKMNQTYMIGPARSLKVYPGDKIDMEAWVYYEGTSGWSSTSTGVGTLITNVAAAFGGVSGGSGESGAIYSGVSGAYGVTGMAGNQGDSQPSAYLNYILFDKDYKFLNAGFTAVPDANFAKQNVSVPTVNISEAGYIFIYLSYEGQSNNWIYFDDFKVTHTKTNVIQYNEYYPFGLQASTSWTRENNRNDYLYNQGNELNQNSGWYETFFRGYDPTLGRFLQVDPLATMYASYSGYNYALNDPVLMNDPAGAQAEEAPFCDYCLGGLNVPTRSGYGTGGHWTDSFTDQYRDYFMMSAAAFKEKYGKSVYEYHDELVWERVNRLGEAYTGSFIWTGRWGNISEYHVVNGKVTKLTTYAIAEDGTGQLNNYIIPEQGSNDFQTKVLDGFQGVLDGLGLIPFAGEIFDGANALIYLARGNQQMAALSGAAMLPILGWAASGSKVVLRTLPWSSKSLAKTAKLLENGASSVIVGSKEEAEELFMGLYQGGNGKALINTTGLNAVETKNLYGSKAGTYHWDLNDTQHGGIPHLQIHDFDGSVIRIFFNH